MSEVEKLLQGIESGKYSEEEILEKVSGLLDEIEEFSERMSVMDFVRMINVAHEKNRYIQIYLMGLQGAGKTTLALHIAARVYMMKNMPSYRAALRNLFFDPAEALEYLFGRHEKVVSSGKYSVHRARAKCIIVDDAGAWLFKLGLDKRTRTFLRFSNYFRTLTACAIFTDVMSIAKLIRDTSGYRILVQPFPRDRISPYIVDPEFNDFIDAPGVEWSIGIVYNTKLSVKFQTYTPRLGFIIFPRYIPPKVYSQYMRIRAEYLVRLGRMYRDVLHVDDGEDALAQRPVRPGNGRNGRNSHDEIKYPDPWK